MKRMFNGKQTLGVLTGLFAIACIVFLNLGSVVEAAEESKEIKHYTDVYITATVPEGYDKDVIVYFKNEDNNESILLRASEGYTKKRKMQEGTYQTWAERKNSTDFACEIVDSCEVSGHEMDFNFTVLSTPQEVSDAEAQAIMEQNSEKISADVAGLDNGKEVFKEFLEATDYIKENEGFLMYYSTLNESVTHKERFLKNIGGTSFTEEDWNAMSDYDVMVYQDTFYNLYNCLIYDEINTEDEFVEEAERIEFFRKIDGGEGYATALEKLVRWQWQYYQQTGTLYNFYAEEGKENAHFNQTQTDNNGLTKEESKELEEARKELLKDDDVKKMLKEEESSSSVVNVPLIIGLVVIIAGIVGIIIKIKKNAK